MQRSFALLILMGFIFGGCAFDVAHVTYHPTVFTAQPQSGKSIALKEEVKITQTPCGYHRTLKQGSNWDLIGSIPEGNVYKPRDQVLTVECSNIYEAYLVVMNQSMVGFYLPVEKGFVELSKEINLPIE